MKALRFDSPTDSARSDLMRRVRQRGTKAEAQVAAVLRELGIRSRRNVQTLPGSPDFANSSRKWAVFVNGCFWHQHQGCFKATIPTRNRAFWMAKFSANCLRDAAKAKALRSMGFKVIVIWECEAAQYSTIRRRLARLK